MAERWYKHIFFLMCFGFIVYSISIYLTPLFKASPENPNSPEGRLVWQKYNCQSCHQLYGLGGYLGPDLTNVYSAKGKGETYIKAFVRSGSKQMPSFDLSPDEIEQLISFLKQTDASGTADPRSFTIRANGMTQRK